MLAVLLVPVLALTGNACGIRPGVGGSSGPPAEPGRALTTWVRGQSQPRRHELYIRNDSQAIYRVTAVTLAGCENVREPCGRHPVDVVLHPGDRARLLTLHSPDTTKATYFDWSYDATAL